MVTCEFVSRVHHSQETMSRALLAHRDTHRLSSDPAVAPHLQENASS